MPIITAISVFVLFLLFYVCIKFIESKNPNPSKTTHNTFIEIVWTLIPCLILIVIAIPSFKLLYKQDIIPKADITVKAIGYQWYWGYEYPDQNIYFESLMVEDKDLKPGQPRLLATDTEVVVPVNKIVKVLITSNVNETWFKADKEGVYYGQCSELCGIKHAFMPITVRVVSEEKYLEWIELAKKNMLNIQIKV